MFNSKEELLFALQKVFDWNKEQGFSCVIDPISESNKKELIKIGGKKFLTKGK